MFLAMIAVNEAMGPVFFRQALARSGELREGADSDAGVEPSRGTEVVTFTGELAAIEAVAREGGRPRSDASHH